MYNYSYINTPIGILKISEYSNAIRTINFCDKMQNDSACKTPLLIQAETELNEYFSGKRINFTVNVSPDGTDFQKKVWNELMKIPYGSTRSYKEIAELIGNPRAFRAVGMANNKNPIPIIIPCHRVIGKNGSLVGYAGGVKQKLLDIEKHL